MIHDLVRYQFDDKSSLKREHVLLVSMGCSWGKCAFCDYQDDKASTVLECDALNKKVLANVHGSEIGSDCLDVTCSASYTEIPFSSLNYVRDICVEKGIKTVILEGHYIFRKSNAYFTDFFGEKGIKTMFRCGVETFDEHIREDILRKGIPGVSAGELAKYFNWINIMYGMEYQSFEQLKKDLEIGLEHFERVNLSIYTTIPSGPGRNEEGIREFYKSDLYRELLTNPKVDIFDEWDDDNSHNVGHDIT